MSNKKNKKYLLIINPLSGQEKYKRYLSLLKIYFIKSKIPLDILFTNYKNHAFEIAKEASKKDEYKVIIGAGGDGTINEIINGLAGSDMKLAIIPWGTLNVFANEMNIPSKPKKIFKLLMKGKSAMIDAGRCNDRLFYLMCSAGFDAYSIRYTDEINIKRFVGITSYFVGNLIAITRYKFPEIKIKIDDYIFEKGTFVLISNITKYAGFFSFTPKASPFDGFVDVYILKEAGRINFIKFLIRIIINFFASNKNKKIFFFKHAIYRAKKIELYSEETVYIQLDGDLFKKLPVIIDVIPKSIEIILPKKTIKKLKRKYKKIII